MRAERSRLSLNHYLSKALDELAEKVFQGYGVTNPLFVLPVDDVDLNPCRCLELLRLLRMIAVPRLFILALGDLDMVRIVLNLKYSGEFVSIAGDAGRRGVSLFLIRLTLRAKPKWWLQTPCANYCPLRNGSTWIA